MKEQKSIPVSKVKRAGKFVSTGAKVGINYLKHYASGAKNKDSLNEANAEEIYNTLSELKGSALKMAQMLSMDQNVMPKEFTKKFTMAQYSAPPLSYPLVAKIFREDFGMLPNQIFDNFSKEAKNAASMGQVHLAEKDGQKLAVKVQYPGIAESIESDLKIVKPFAMRMIGAKGVDVNRYFDEVKTKLLEEADYELEIKRSVHIAEKSSELKDIEFPQYLPQFSSKRIITMSWLHGNHLNEFLALNPSQELRNKIGQNLWDFYTFQINQLRMVQADPHPGNFLFRENGEIGVIDFGCVKEIEPAFYDRFFALLNPSVLLDSDKLKERMFDLELLHPSDSAKEQAVFMPVFEQSLKLLARPFHTETFDFGDKAYVDEIFAHADKLSKMPELRQSKKARGPKDALFINRTFFGLYNILHTLNAVVDCPTDWPHLSEEQHSV